MSPQNPKLLDALTAAELLKSLREQGKSIVFTNGCFDILHPGHVAYLQDARSLGDFLIVGLNSDASVSRLKGPNRPIVDQESRAFVLAGLRAVDAVIFFNEDTPLDLINQVKPDILVKGGDYKKQDIVGATEVEANGGQVIVIPFVEGFSTSSIIDKIK